MIRCRFRGTGVSCDQSTEVVWQVYCIYVFFQDPRAGLQWRGRFVQIVVSDLPLLPLQHLG